MPSPFPGMDPYLEGSLWTSVHSQLAAEIARQLSPLLDPKYVALTTERYVIDTPDDISVTTSDIYPDVAVKQVGVEIVTSKSALLEAPLHLATVIPAQFPLVNLQIRDVRSRQLVTSIELLSPVNKRGPGRRRYVNKRQRILLSSTHLLEIDLLRRGRRVPMQEPLPSYPYFVLLSRESHRPMTDTWPIRLQDALPPVPIPLLDGDPDVRLDLQAAFNHVYDTIGYRRIVDYTRPPEITLPEKDAAWAAELLRNAKVRT